jgi:hypothetical protein
MLCSTLFASSYLKTLPYRAIYLVSTNTHLKYIYTILSVSLYICINQESIEFHANRWDLMLYLY